MLRPAHDHIPARSAVGAVGVIVRGDRALLVLSRHRGWEPPGGYCDENEFVIDALRREVLEETGYVIDPTRLTGVYQCEREHSILTFVFRCEARHRTASPIEESLDVKWWPLEQLASIVTYPPHLLRLHEALHPTDLRFVTYTIDPFTVNQAVDL